MNAVVSHGQYAMMLTDDNWRPLHIIIGIPMSNNQYNHILSYNIMIINRCNTDKFLYWFYWSQLVAFLAVPAPESRCAGDAVDQLKKLPSYNQIDEGISNLIGSMLVTKHTVVNGGIIDNSMHRLYKNFRMLRGFHI